MNLFLIFSLMVLPGFSAEKHCQVCSMTLRDDSRSHLVLKKEAKDATPLHVCSASCVIKARKYDSALTQVEVANFNAPSRFLPGEKAFFLIHSEKIKDAMGPHSMPPYLPAFVSKKEAEAALAQFGGGIIIEGFEKALRAVKP